MKKVPLNVVQVSEDAKIDYRLQMISVLSSPENPQVGTTYEEMGKVLPLIEKLEKAQGGFVLLEDAEHEIVSARLKAAKFGINNTELFNMIRDIVDAPATSVEPVEYAESN